MKGSQRKIKTNDLRLYDMITTFSLDAEPKVSHGFFPNSEVCPLLQTACCLPQRGLRTEHEPGSTPAYLNFLSLALLHLLENIILPLFQEHASSDCGQDGFQECFLLSTGK